jgi:hypothetical protein
MQPTPFEESIGTILFFVIVIVGLSRFGKKMAGNRGMSSNGAENRPKDFPAICMLIQLPESMQGFTSSRCRCRGQVS